MASATTWSSFSLRSIVTGGCGFVGSTLACELVNRGDRVLAIDTLLKSTPVPALAPLTGNESFVRLQADVTDRTLTRSLFREFKPDRIFHLTAPRADEPGEAFDADIAATFSVLDAARIELERRPPEDRDGFRIVCANRRGASAPSTGAAPDIRSAPAQVRAQLLDTYAAAYRLQVITCVADNAFGPHDKRATAINRLIAALRERGQFDLVETQAFRDWLPVEDLATGMIAAAEKGVPGKTYEFSVGAERRDSDVAEIICSLLDRKRPLQGRPWMDLVTLADARSARRRAPPALDAGPAERDLNWRPRGFHAGIDKLIDWPELRPAASPEVSHAAE